MLHVGAMERASSIPAKDAKEAMNRAEAEAASSVAAEAPSLAAASPVGATVRTLHVTALKSKEVQALRLDVVSPAGATVRSEPALTCCPHKAN